MLRRPSAQLGSRFSDWTADACQQTCLFGWQLVKELVPRGYAPALGRGRPTQQQRYPETSTHPHGVQPGRKPSPSEPWPLASPTPLTFSVASVVSAFLNQPGWCLSYPRLGAPSPSAWQPHHAYIWFES